ncbi:hypothetical protein CFK38_01540 [Brachybacterium vulturis]|uniref:Uncharacterized protein n=1 Tax=Brachybacterium vulturis TaxID=2017484 RepID=A0A291GJW5_9MICO|nr:hypothetical protein [Brachybacterium vulturis]ATG50352.1 hypothetical protein CFK38_01540 [Brachybacterium vulturis]
MTTVLGLLPLLSALVLSVVLLSSVVALFRRHQHPWRILQRGLGGASILAILGVIGVVPSALWWLPWLLTLALTAGVVVACRRLLVRTPPAEPTRREAAHLAAPGRLNLGIEVVLYLALLVIALVAG